MSAKLASLLRGALPGALAAFLAACTGGYEATVPPNQRAVLAGPDRLELLALDPESALEAASPGGARFHGFRVLGAASVEPGDAIERLTGLVREAIDEAGEEAALCFLPRHGLRFQRGEERLDAVLCFRCFRGRLIGPGATAVEVLLSSEHEEAVSAAFRGLGLKLAPR